MSGVFGIPTELVILSTEKRLFWMMTSENELLDSMLARVGRVAYIWHPVTLGLVAGFLSYFRLMFIGSTFHGELGVSMKKLPMVQNLSYFIQKSIS